MNLELADLIKETLEKAHGIAVTKIECIDGVAYDIEGFGSKGAFKTKVGLMVVEMGERRVHNQR